MHLRRQCGNRLGMRGLLAAVLPEVRAGLEVPWGEGCQRRDGLVVGVANLNGPARLHNDPRLFFGQDNVRHDSPPADSAYRPSLAAVNSDLRQGQTPTASSRREATERPACGQTKPRA